MLESPDQEIVTNLIGFVKPIHVAKERMSRSTGCQKLSLKQNESFPLSLNSANTSNTLNKDLVLITLANFNLK